MGGGTGTEEAKQATLISREKEGVAAKDLIPRIRSLQRYLTDTSSSEDPEAHQLLQHAVNIAVGYAAGYQNVRDQLVVFDTQQQAATGKTLRARPVEGEIDYAELSREHTARYPKIRARLAE